MNGNFQRLNCVKVRFDNTEGRFHAGMSVEVKFPDASK